MPRAMQMLNRKKPRESIVRKEVHESKDSQEEKRIRNYQFP
jgi:hypothetical protein